MVTVDFPLNSLLSCASKVFTIPKPSLSKVFLSIDLSKIVVDKVPLKSVNMVFESSVITPSNIILDKALIVSKDCVTATSFIFVIRTLGFGTANFIAGSPKE